MLRLGRRYTVVVVVAAVLAVGAMEWALLTHDFSLQYVAENNARSTPLLFTITGLWAALEGSILLWVLILGGYLGVTAYQFRHRAADPLVAWATLVGFVVALFFFALMLGPANPFETLDFTPADGQGPNPLLQNHPLMAFHPPMLYLGYVGMTVPFMFAIAALVTGRFGEGWLTDTRRTTLVAWGFLSVGIILGAWWSYEVLGWGGYWAWDPVENASLLPWLTATAFIHSVIVQERRGMLRVWNLSLVIATFCLTILGTFLTRSGVLNSVHSFTESDIGPWLLGFLAFVAIGSVALDRVARRQAAIARAHRLPGVARGRVPREQPAVRRARVRGAARHRVPAARRGAAGPPAVGGGAVLRPHGHADRDRAAVPHGGRAGAAVAGDVGRGAAAAARDPGVVRRRRDGGLGAARRRVGVDAARVRARRVRGRRHRAPVRRRASAPSTRAARRGGSAPARTVGGSPRLYGGLVVHIGVVAIAVALAASSAFTTKAEVRLKQGRVRDGRRLPRHLPEQRVDRGDQKNTVKANVRIERGADDLGVYAPAISTFPGDTTGIGTPSVRTGLAPRRVPHARVVAQRARPGHARRRGEPDGRVDLDRRRARRDRHGHRVDPAAQARPHAGRARARGPPRDRRARGGDGVKHPARWIALAVAVVVVAFSVVLATQVGNDPREDAKKSQLPGEAAPKFTVETLDGETLTSRDLAGKAVIVNFWNSWCIPCREEHPALKQFYARHTDDPDFVLRRHRARRHEGRGEALGRRSAATTGRSPPIPAARPHSPSGRAASPRRSRSAPTASSSATSSGRRRSTTSRQLLDAARGR